LTRRNATCVSACAEGAIELQAEKYCDGLAACLGTCPQNAISIIEKETDPFDPKAVEKYLSQKRFGGKGYTSPPPLPHAGTQ